MPTLAPCLFARRDCLRVMAATMLAAGLAGCSRPLPLLRVGSNGWPGYLLIEWAAESGLYRDGQIRVIRFPSSTLVMQGLASGELEAGCLTLDEVLALRAEGVSLQVVAVLDVSAGADVLLAQDSITELGQLAGKRIGVEQSAVGAVMLDAVLGKAHLLPSDVTIVPLLLDQHEQAFRSGKVDALVTMEPFAKRLLAAGAHLLFSSVAIPGRIVDVLAVRSDVAPVQMDNLRRLLDGHFRVLTDFGQQDRQTLAGLAMLLGERGKDVASYFWGMNFPDRQENLSWFDGQSPRLLQSANALMAVMQSAGLLRTPLSLDDLLLPEVLRGNR
ncbi:ABC transporter substrate-binding protein [Vogesella oryzae]|uniref:ABC transporter substrate-binding protein n=1 Tax=Vogesella oryzae TaxID=1735285 RepID=UPI001583916D|nr:ABC transporter substrate-binding protein [Vogesella oryzae]